VTERGDASPDADRAHYSYTHYANRRIAEGFDELRFGGPVGRYLLEAQEAFLIRAMGGQSRAVLDVGTGTGRAAIGLARAGARVVGVDASAEMLDVARQRAHAAGVRVEFQRGDAHALAFADRSFDVVISLRVLMHTPGWRQCLAECCRVSRWRVVIDFPALVSFAALESGVRRLSRLGGRNVEAYRVLSASQVGRAFAQHGFRVQTVDRQFALPIAFHKMIGSVTFTRHVERAIGATGLSRVIGSPVTMVAER
jgi:ubiquinone/menaquinone biosynthesis C-methylase UbiE